MPNFEKLDSPAEIEQLLGAEPIESIFPDLAWENEPDYSFITGCTKIAGKFVYYSRYDLALDLLNQVDIKRFEDEVNFLIKLITALKEKNERSLFKLAQEHLFFEPLVDPIIDNLCSEGASNENLLLLTCIKKIRQSVNKGLRDELVQNPKQRERPAQASKSTLSIVYFQEEFPKHTETFVTAEICELVRKGISVKVITLRKNEELLSSTGLGEHCLYPTSSGTPNELLESIAQIVNLHKADYVHSHWTTTADRFTKHIAENLKMPFGFSCHAADLWLRGNRVEPEALKVLGNHHLCRAIFAEGTYHQNYLMACGVPENRICIVPNSVDSKLLPMFDDKKASKIRKLLCVGRPVEKKGFFVAVDAVRLLRLSGLDVELEIVGGADASTAHGAKLQAYITQFSFVKSTPLLAHKDVLQKISEADCLLMPSVITQEGDSDGIPTVLTEAMLMRVPVISTSVGSIRDLVIDGVTGFLALPGDPISLMNAINNLSNIFSNGLRASTFLDKAQSHAKRSSIENSISTLLSFWECALQNKHKNMVSFDV